MDKLTALNQLIEELQGHADALYDRIVELVDAVHGLVDQQAMPDDFWKGVVERSKATVSAYNEFLREER